MTDAQIPIVFTGAIDESTDARHLPPGTLVSATNGVFDQDGQLSVRYGFTMLNSPPTSVFRLAVFAFELVCFTLAGGCYSYSPSESAFVSRDAAASLGVTHAPLTNTTTGFTSWSIVDVNGYRIVAWADAQSNDVLATVYDQSTGAIAVSQTVQTSPATFALQMGVVGNTVVLLTADSGAANIRAHTLNTSPLGVWSPSATIVSDANYTSTSGIFTAAFGSNIFAIAYEKVVGGGSSLQVLGYNASLVNQYTVTNALTGNTGNISGMGSRLTVGEQYWVMFYAGTSGYANKVVAAELNPATGVISTSFSVGFDTAGSQGNMQIGLDRVDSTHQIATVSDGLNAWIVQLAIGATTSSETFNMRTMSAPHTIATGTAIAMWSDTSTANGGAPGGGYYLVDLHAGTPNATPTLLAVLAPGISPLINEVGGTVQWPAVPWATNAAGQYETVAPIDVNLSRQGLELFTVDPNSTANYRFMPAVLGKEAYFSGLRYDSRALVENGFAQQPTFTLSNVSGSGHTRQYAVTYGWIDSKGNLEESAPAAVASIASGSTPDTNVVIRTTGISRKQRNPGLTGMGQIALIVYRTQDIASGDETFYRVTQEPFTVLNDPTTGTVTFADTVSDTSLTDGTHPVLYTVSGELAHNTPETFTDIAVHMQRVWGIGADQRLIWYSQQYVDGSMPAWSNLSQMSVDDAGEPLTAIVSLYDKLIIFTRTKVFVVYGSGPSIAGTGNDLTTPQRIPSPSGCIDPRSTVVTTQGVFFQSERGIEVVGNDLSVTFIGQPISTTTATYPVVTSAVMDETSSVVRFTVVNTETPGSQQAGRVLNFDLRRGRWMVHELSNGGTKGAVAAAPQSAVQHPTLGYVEGHNDNPLAGIVARENTTADATPWLDYGSTFIPLSWTTGWIKANDLQGWGTIRRIRILGNYYDNHALSFTLNFDYQATGEVHSFSDTTIFSTFSSSWEQLMVHPGPARRCQAIQVSGTSVAPSTEAVNTGRGAGFLGLAFEMRPQKGGFRNVPITARG